MQTYYADAANAVIVLFCLGLLAGMIYLSKMTKANGFIWKAVAFGWLVVCRILLVAQVEPFATYSAQVTFLFYILFGVGMILTIVKLRGIYRNGYGHAREYATAGKAAEMVRLAEKAAFKAAESASKAMEAAEHAEAMAHASKQAAGVANRATEESRQ